ncbi:MAG: hypothetical protein LBF33_00015 [Oscillospiraceae bacterium]|jgi:hypothetical protein|nr:hypothetical protein [Oscillospiraceae bacterium]
MGQNKSLDEKDLEKAAGGANLNMGATLHEYYSNITGTGFKDEIRKTVAKVNALGYSSRNLEQALTNKLQPYAGKRGGVEITIALDETGARISAKPVFDSKYF